MQRRRLAMFALSFVLGAGAMPANAASGAAKAWLAQALQAAQKWQPDAALVSISTLSTNMDGTADKWSFMFHSPKAKKGYTVDVRDGKIVDTLEVRPHVVDAVGADFIDSTQAMAGAKKNGLKVAGKPAMSLMVMGQATRQSGANWTVTGFKTGDVSVILDAKSGKFVTRQTTP